MQQAQLPSSRRLPTWIQSGSVRRRVARLFALAPTRPGLKPASPTASALQIEGAGILSGGSLAPLPFVEPLLLVAVGASMAVAMTSPAAVTSRLACLP